MQLAVLAAQREYARTGDHALEELLVSVLLDRAREADRNLRQIALEESIAVIPKLTEKQVDILTQNTLVNEPPALVKTKALPSRDSDFVSHDIRVCRAAGNSHP